MYYVDTIRILWKYPCSVDIIRILWKYPLPVDIIRILWIYPHFMDIIRILWILSILITLRATQIVISVLYFTFTHLVKVTSEEVGLDYHNIVPDIGNMEGESANKYRSLDVTSAGK